GNAYSVPAVTGGTHPLRMIRPNPAPNHVLIFSPYLIHGGGVNLNPATTRMSLEMRFSRRRGG
ncbi:MAG TPA: phytanoyl-CoA dioxygenase, partial [Polyangia bacterium]|nr:phytanoyl-CoA dioxygenase [Polyangia bacterium]